MVTGLGDKVSDLGHKVTDFSHDLGDKVHDFGDKVKGVYEDAKPQAQHALDEASKFGKGFMGTVHDKAGGVSEMIGSVFGGMMGMQPKDEDKGNS